MPLPDERSTTYVNLDVPDIDADDLNDMQDNIVDLWAAIRGRDFFFEEDFLGNTTVNPYKWASIASSGGGATPAVTTDVPNASGILDLNASGSDGSASINTLGLEIGFADFRFAAKAKRQNIGGGTSNVVFQIGAASFEARADTNPGNWCVNLNGSRHNLAIACSGYQFLEIRRTNGVFEFLIDGTVRYTEVLALTFSNTSISLGASRNASGTTRLQTDWVRGWFRR